MRTRWGPRKSGLPRNAYYTCNAAFSKRGCSHTKLYRAADLEGEVMRLVDDVLSDPGRITRDVDEAIEREKGAVRDPDRLARHFSAVLARVAS